MTVSKPLRITAAVSPSDRRICAFVFDKPIFDGSALCRDPEAARGSPLFERLFALPGVVQVWMAGNRVTVAYGNPPLWENTAKIIAHALRGALAEGRPLVSAAPPVPSEKLAERVRQVLITEVNPGLAQHGGRAELVELRNGVAEIRLTGGCQGCGAAQMTLTLGIEQSLRAKVPELLGVRDVTDHGAGQNPYYRGEGKTPFG